MLKVHTQRRDGIGEVVLNSPPLNILTRAVLAELRAALAELADDASLRVLLLRSEGAHFSAGADVGEHLPPQYESMIPEFMRTVTMLRGFPLPTVAAVRGRCLGGGFELVQATDMVVAGEGATFGQPEILLGVIAPAASALLPLLISPSRAAEILFTGDPISARDAHEAGLVSRVVDDDLADEAARELCSRMARHSGAALRVAKRALRAGEIAALEKTFAAAEQMYCRDLMHTRDALAGLNAFMAKRQPAWVHQ